MSIVVPFDGNPLSKAALHRGGEFGDVLGDEVIAVSIVPNRNARYARRKGWLEDDEPFDAETIVSRLSEQVYSLVPEAQFEYDVAGRYAQPGEIAGKLRRIAHEADAELVVLGSDNAGHIVTDVSSVASPVAADDSYDVLIVRQTRK